MIYITGDTHGDFAYLLKREFKAENGDYLIICGDFGGVWDGSDEENRILDSLAELPYMILFIDGNHENFDLLAQYPVELWNEGKVHRIRGNIIHLMRGQFFLIDGVSFFTMGGGKSHDNSAGILEPDDPNFKYKKKALDRDYALYRVNHLSWWKEEIPSSEEMDEGLTNLSKRGNKVDVVLSHSAPSSIVDIFSGRIYLHDELTDYLEAIKNRCEFSYWFFGHYHDNQVINNKFILLYEKIIDLRDL